MRTPGPRLDLSRVCKRFGPTVALDDVCLTVAPGEVHAIVGENGAGKSTLVKILSGAVMPDSGTLRLDGAPYRPRDPLDARRHGVAMVYQELSLAPHLTVAENIVLGVEPSRGGFVRRAGMRAASGAALARLGREDLSLDARAGALPVAVQQLVEIARALARSDVRVLILDEPTSSLAGDDVQRLFAAIRALKARGASVLYISHVLEEVQDIADTFTVLRDGRAVGGGEARTTARTEIVRMMAGRRMDALFPRSTHAPGEVILELDGVAGMVKPASATLTLRRGEVVGIGGLMGSGRTELLRAVFGLDPVRHGRIRVAAWSGSATPRRRLAQGVGLLSEDRKGEGLALSMSLADNATLSRLANLGPAGFILPSRQQAAAARWIDRLGIRCRGSSQAVGELSGGNQQKVALARLLHHDVDVFLLDEPTRGIDVGSKAEIYALIDELALAGKAILIVTSYLPELLGVCDRVAVMHRGRLGAPRPAAGLAEHDVLMEAMGLGTGGQGPGAWGLGARN
jgi:ribose transport system ATP-binding protein